MIRAGSSSYSSVPHPFDTFPSFPFCVSVYALARGRLLQTLQLMGVAGRGSRSPHLPWRCRSSRGHPSTTYVPARCRRTASSRDGSAHAPQTFQPKGDEITHQSSRIHAPELIRDCFRTRTHFFLAIVGCEHGQKVFDQRTASVGEHK